MIREARRHMDRSRWNDSRSTSPHGGTTLEWFEKHVATWMDHVGMIRNLAILLFFILIFFVNREKIKRALVHFLVRMEKRKDLFYYYRLIILRFQLRFLDLRKGYRGIRCRKGVLRSRWVGEIKSNKSRVNRHFFCWFVKKKNFNPQNFSKHKEQYFFVFAQNFLIIFFFFRWTTKGKWNNIKEKREKQKVKNSFNMANSFWSEDRSWLEMCVKTK